MFKKEWLTDYNCDSGDAGGLPGYPLSPTRGDGTPIAGYCTDGTQLTEATCIAQYFCTVAGSCNAPASAATEEECGVCATAAGQPTATNRFTQTECVKDSDGDDDADGEWSAGTWTPATDANCASLGGVWKARTWIDAPAGDATTGWQAVKAATDSAVVGALLNAATKTFEVADVTAGGTGAIALAAGDRVKVDKSGANTCAANSCPICGTYHIAEIIVDGGAGNDRLVFVEAFTGDTAAGDASHCEVSRPAVTLQDMNKQCCSCVPATGSTVSAASLAVHKTESECVENSVGARLGGTWVCTGVGPYCTTD